MHPYTKRWGRIIETVRPIISHCACTYPIMYIHKSLVALTVLALAGIVISGMVLLYVQKKDAERNAANVVTPTLTPTPDTSLKHVPNEATRYCESNGGTVGIEKNDKGKEYGVCTFDDRGGICEEGAFLRDECPKGGLRIKNLSSKAGRFCLITGGEYSSSGIDEQGVERGRCLLPPDTECEVWAYYNGECSRPVTPTP